MLIFLHSLSSFLTFYLSWFFSLSQVFFPLVTCAKPRSSRASSLESFVVCQHYQPPTGYKPTMANPLLSNCAIDFSQLDGVNRVVVPFLACGDLSAYDSDRTYQLSEGASSGYVHHEPTQLPIDPPYRLACQLKKNNQMAKQTMDVVVSGSAPSAGEEGSERRTVALSGSDERTDVDQVASALEHL